MSAEADADRSIATDSGIPSDALALRYAARSIGADLARGAAGLAIVLVLLAGAGPPWPLAVPLLGLAGLFAVFLKRTWQRGRSVVWLHEGGIEIGGGAGRGRRRLAWRDLERFRLRWFGPRRPGAGWLDLELRGGGARLGLTSGLEGFEQVLERAAAAAERNALELDPASRANLAEVRGLRGPAGSSGLRG